MKRKKFAIAGLFICLIAGIAGASAPARAVSSLASASLPELPTWQQVNSNGFGDLQVKEVSALAAFNDYLYAGTFNPIDPAPGPVYDGAQIFRSSNGTSWNAVTLPGFGQLHDIRSPSILDMLVFNGRLYASTGRGDGPGQIWRTVNGTTWAPMTETGFSNPDTVDFTALAEYGGWIYAGARNLVSGAQIWRSFSGDNNTWAKVAPGAQGPFGTRITGFAQFGGALYAAVESSGSAQIWRSTSGTSWQAVMSNGFGNSNTNSTGGMAVFAGKLYVGAGNTVEGAQLWRTSDASIWEKVNNPGFGAPNNQKIEMVFVFGNKLYVSVKNGTTGIEIWRSPDGTLWEQANQDGFGDSHNTASNGSNATENFLSRLYLGTVNLPDGGELWRMEAGPVPPTATPTPTPTPPPGRIPAYIPLILGQP